MEKRFPCPCCGYLVHAEPAGSYDICPICFWEDDISQLRFASRGGGANHASLLEGQQNYLAYGACEERVKPYVRPPLPDEQREAGWRLLNPDIDNIEEPISGVDYGGSYPKDYLSLYYWRPTYWRRALKAEQEQIQQQMAPAEEANQ